MLNINEILISKRNKLIVENITNNTNSYKNKEIYVATLLKSIESYGYELSGEIIETIFYMSKDELIIFYNELTNIIKDSLGCKENMKPLFINFPQSVMETNEGNLYLTQLLDGYGLRINGDILLKEVDRFPLVHSKKLIVLNKGNKNDLIEILQNLLTSKSSLSSYDNKVVEYLLEYFTNEKELKSIITDLKITNREILSVASSVFFIHKGVNPNMREDFLTFAKSQYNSSTDILRAITYLSNGDISLKESTLYISMKRADRRLFLRLLEDMCNIEEDMYRHKNKWIKVGEKLHPREYSYLINVNTAFLKLRENLYIETFNKRVEKAITKKDVSSLIKILKERPTEYSRRLDELVRLSLNKEYLVNDILQCFNEIVRDVPSIAILSLIAHFSERNVSKERRVFFPKGGSAKTYGVDNDLEPLINEICDNILLICTNSLYERFSDKENLTSVFLDEELKQYAIPTVQRNLSKSLKNAGRGSRIKLKDSTEFIRPFIYWKDTEDGKESDYHDFEDRNDLDLSVALLDKDLNSVEILTYYSLSPTGFEAYHSGDIQSAPNGASEYVDLNIEQLISKNVKYAVILVNSYTEKDFVDIPLCFSGIMERDNDTTGEVYEPLTVENKSDLITKSTNALVSIIDLEERVNIWCDIGMKKDDFQVNNITSNNETIILNTQAMLDKKFLNLYQLFELHVNARGGTIVEKMEEAETIFSIDKGITPFMTDIILSEYL